MKATELKKLVKAMRQCGVIRLKTQEYELELGDEPIKPLAASEEKQIPHKIEDLKSVMKLSDEELIDRMFPDTEPKEEGEASELPN